MKQKRRGFTLIELLAVIVILAIIALIAVPVIMNIISSARKSAFEDTAYGLIDAGEMYYASALLENGMASDVEFTITDGKFVGENKLEVKGALPTNGKITVTKDGKVAIAISNGTYCVIKGYDDSKIKIDKDNGNCKLPEEQTVNTLKDIVTTTSEVVSVATCATDGTVCDSGTKFAIKVNNNEIYNFYVISDADNTVTLIMDRNINEETVAWIVKPDYITAGGTEEEWGEAGNNNKGPLTPLNYLESQTSSWTNIAVQTFTLTDSQYGTITRPNARARMLTVTEALAVGCTGYYSGMSETCPAWLYGNLSNPGYDFWLSSAYADDSGTAWSISGAAITSYDTFTDSSNGIRPVIEISK